MKFAALAALLLAAPAAAQNRAAEIDFENSLRDSDLAGSAQSRAAVQRAIVAMNDGPEAGGKVVSYIHENGINVIVRSQAEASKFVIERGRKTILLAEALPNTPRVYGALIAKEIAALMLADMPACAERSYMRRAISGRVWAELGGEPSKLPVVEPLTGDKVAAISDEISLWADKGGAEMALYKIGEAEKLASLPDMTDAAKDPAVKAKLDAANARFVAFLIDEKPARQAAGLR